MKSNRSGLFTKLPMLVFGLLLLLPTVAVAQIGWSQDDWRRERERQRREEIRERRRERRQERRERRVYRRNDGYYNNGVYNNGVYNNGYGNRTYGYGNRDDYPNYGGSYDMRQTALNAGYNNGIEEGRRDRQRGEGYNFQDEGEFQSATKDYSSRYGDRETYRRYFREAFARGYRDGYNGY